MGFSSDFAAAEPAREEIDSTQGPLVLEFGAPWCSHCRRAAPHIAAAFEAFASIPHIKVEDGPGRPLGRSYRVKLWPTLIFLESGKEIARVIRPTETAPIVDALAQIASSAKVG